MKSTILFLVLMAIFIAAAHASNPYDTTSRPFAIGGAFKRVEKKNPVSSFACYNTTLGDWSEYKWADATLATTTKVLQLRNGHTISMNVVTTNMFTYFVALAYWDLDTMSIMTTSATVLYTTGIPEWYLSYDQKKLYIGGMFYRIGTKEMNAFKIICFDLSGIPKLSEPVDISSTYNLGVNLASVNLIYPISTGHLLYIYLDKIIIYDPASTSWKEISAPNSAEYKLSSSTGELYAKVVDTNSPWATSFLKYDSNVVGFTNVKTLPASSLIKTNAEAANYVKFWTVGGNAIYYAVFIANPSFTVFEEGMQNIQKISLPSASGPESISKTRLTISTSRDSFDVLPISSVIQSIYYDENTKQLILNLLSEASYQIYGVRNTDNNAPMYELTYRLQPMGQVVAYDSGSDSFIVPYGGAFKSAAAPISSYSTSGVTCFKDLSDGYYRTWAPNFAVYDQGKDMFVAENYLSGKFDYDWWFNTQPTVNAVENSDSDVVYVGGYFRTISGTVFNSIVARTRTGLVALGSGVRKNTFDFNYFDSKPGTVRKLVRSKDNRYLFVLGDFNRAGDIYVNGLAYWDIEKKTWNKLETSATDVIADMDYDGRYLYIIGTIGRAGKYVVKNAARFDMETKTWLPMNGGLNDATYIGMVVDGKFVALSSSGSGVNFVNKLAVWSTNSWKSVDMEAVSNEGCYSTNEVCTSDISYVSATYYKGKVYFIGNSKIYRSDSSMSKGSLYLNGAISNAGPTTKFFNYPKSNTIGVATVGGTEFVEYNIDTKNVQHTPTRDGNVLSDDSINVFSSAPRNNFSIALFVIVAILVTLLNM